MKIWKFVKKNNKFFYKFSNTKNFPIIDPSPKINIKKTPRPETPETPETQILEPSKNKEIIVETNVENSNNLPPSENKKNNSHSLKVLRLKEIYKQKIDKKKISEIVKKRLFDIQDEFISHTALFNEKLKKAEEIEKEKMQEAKIKGLKENLTELIEDFNIENFSTIIHDIYNEKLYYYDIIVQLENLYNIHFIYLDSSLSDITRDILVYGVANKIIRFKEQTFVKMINSHISNKKKLTFSQLNRFLTSLKRVEKYISSSNINELHSVRLMNHIKKNITDGNVIMTNLDDLYSFSFSIKNHREIFDHYYPVNEKLWRNFNSLIQENSSNMDIDSTLLSASLITIYKDIYQHRVFISLQPAIEVVNNYIINFIQNYELLPILTREKLGLIISNILHYSLNFIFTPNTSNNLKALEKILGIYQEKFVTSNIMLTKIDIENLYMLGRIQGELQQNFFIKMAKIFSVNKFSFPNEVVEKTGVDEINPLLFNIGKFLHGFSQNNLDNIDFWDKVITKMKDVNITFGKKGSEMKYIYYYILNVFKENEMQGIREMFTNSIFNKEFEDIYKSHELIEILATLPKDKIEFIEKTKIVLNNYQKFLKHQKNEKKLKNLINILTILTSYRKDLFTSEVSNLVAKELISAIRLCNLNMNEIVILLKAFYEIKSSLYAFTYESFNEELVKELFSFISSASLSEDVKQVLKPLYYSELIDNMSLVELNYFLELNGLNDKRDVVLKIFPMINYERSSFSIENIHNI